MSNSIEDDVRLIMSTVLDVNSSVINDECTPYTIESWDSLKHMNLVVALEKKYGLEFDDSDIEIMTSYKTIVSIIQSYIENV